MMQTTHYCEEHKGSPHYPTKEVKAKGVNVWMHPSLMALTHDYSCTVCRERKAVLNMSTGIMQPCWECREKGYKVLKVRRNWLLRLVGVK